MSQFYNDSIFWIETDKIKPNPYQPRREFDQAQLENLADSVRQYGILQALVVTRLEVSKEDGGLAVEYELISGERRLRAAKIAQLTQVPVMIRMGEESDLLKLELAIIENIQREDLNAVYRARAFHRLANEFKFKHEQIGKKVGKSRAYVTNTMRILSLPQEIVDALGAGQISEGHTRPLLMLDDRPEEQVTLFKEIVYKKLSVRDAESMARRIAVERIRKKKYIPDPELMELEEHLAESLGTRVTIERKENGGKLLIDFFSNDDLHNILGLIRSNQQKNPSEMLDRHIANLQQNGETPAQTSVGEVLDKPADDRSSEEKKEEELYSIKNFTL